jgi:enediyne biosynthesis protein E4
VLYSSMGMYTRTVRASSGYLSGDASRVHFGFLAGAEIESLEIDWGDGVISRIEDIQSDTHITVTRAR